MNTFRKKSLLSSKLSASGRYFADEELMKISKRFKRAKLITAAILIIFVAGMLISNKDELSVENIRYLLRYLDAEANVYSYTTEYKTISYNADPEMTFGIYRGDFVVADSESVSIYATSGSNVLNTTSYMTNPVILPTSGYLMVYDLGGNTYNIYNTFSVIHTESLDYPITGAAYSDSGNYALITKTAEYRSAVFVYDRDYNLVSRVLKDKNKLIMDADLTDDGSMLLVTTAVCTTDGDFNAEIMINEVNSDTIKTQIRLNDIFPIESKYNSDGFYVVCDSAMYFYSGDGTFRGRFSYGDRTPLSCVMTDDYAFMVFADSVVGDSHSVYIFDTAGNQVGRKSFTGKFVRLLFNNGDIFILTDSHVIRTELSTSRTSYYAMNGSCVDLSLARDDTLYLCYAGYAASLDINGVLAYDPSEPYEGNTFYVEAERQTAETQPFVWIPAPETESEAADEETEQTD